MAFILTRRSTQRSRPPLVSPPTAMTAPRTRAITLHHAGMQPLPLPLLKPRQRPPGLQAKLTVGDPHDAFEREADQVADRIMRMREPRGNPVTLSAPGAKPRIQRTCAACADELKRQPIEEKGEELQAKALPGRTPRAGEAVGSQSSALRGGGRPLPHSLRTFFEPRFGYDFRQTRIHTDTRAAESAERVRAKAFTVGRHIVFGAAQFAPHTAEGKRLLAHELTHVVQQSQGSRFSRAPDLRIQRQPANCTPAVTGVNPPRDPQQEVADAHDTALNWAQTARREIQTLQQGGTVRPMVRRSLNFHFANPNQGQLTTIRNRANRIVTRLNRGSRIYFCNTGGSIDCRNPNVQAASFCPSTTEYTRICPFFFNASLLMQPLVLLHEAAHAAGACAHIYTNQGNYPGNNPPFNAEAYAQFGRSMGMLLGSVPLRRRRPVVP